MKSANSGISRLSLKVCVLAWFVCSVQSFAQLTLSTVRGTATVTEVDAGSAQDIRPMRDAVEGAMIPMQVAAGFVGTLSWLGLVLALVGVYGSVSYSVGRRTREMGIRAALGATRARLVRTALRDGVAVVVAGILVGLVSALVGIRPIVDLLPAGVNPWDPLTLSGTGAFVLLAGGGAMLAPGLPGGKGRPFGDVT